MFSSEKGSKSDRFGRHSEIRFFALAVSVVVGLSSARAAAPAFDSAADPVYDSGWPENATGGYGFTPFGWSATVNAGVFIGDSSGNGNAPSGDINTAGRAWGFYANSGGYSQAGRNFTVGGPNNMLTLAPRQVFTIHMDTGYVDSSTNGQVAFALINKFGGTAFEFDFYGGLNIYTYDAHNGFGTRYPNIPYTTNGLTASVLLGYNGDFTLIVTLNGGGATVINDSFGGEPNIVGLHLFNSNAGAGPSHDLFFNTMSVADVPNAVAASVGTNAFSVSFTADANRTYRLEHKNNLTDPDWLAVAGVSDFTASSNGPVELTDPNATSSDHGFYRVRLLLP
jgi:hypothetical protein